MRSTQSFNISLTDDLAELVKSKVSTGEYATASDVIRDGLHALMERDQAVEQWLQQQVCPAYDALKKDPARAVTIEQVRARIAAERAGGQ